MKHIIDAGAWFGDSIKKLRHRFGNDAIIHSFEPNPFIASKFKGDDKTVLHQKALWVLDGSIEMYFGEDGNESQSSSLVDKKKNVLLDSKVKVECIDFDKWIKDNFKKEDYIIIKMDIEGAEYEVLNKMIESGSIDYVDELFVEWHWRKLKGMNRKDHNKFVNRLPLKAGYWR